VKRNANFAGVAADHGTERARKLETLTVEPFLVARSNCNTVSLNILDDSCSVKKIRQSLRQLHQSSFIQWLGLRLRNTTFCHLSQFSTYPCVDCFTNVG